MRLHNQILLAACGAVLLQLTLLIAFFYCLVDPKIKNLEKSLVVKELHSNLEILQRELFHLEHMTQLLAKDKDVKSLLTSPATTEQNQILQKQMKENEINLTVVLNVHHKVLWETVIDFANEKVYPQQAIVPSLWEQAPNFFIQPSPLSIQASFFNTPLGPFLIVSVPINDINTQKIEGTIITGKLITQDMLRLFQSLTLTDLKLWPLGEQNLNEAQRELIQRLDNSDSDFIVEENGPLLRGYMALHDLSGTPSILMSLTQNRNFSQISKAVLLEAGGILLSIQIILLIIVYLIVHVSALLPIRKLAKTILYLKQNWEPTPFNPDTIEELNLLIEAITQFLNRNKTRLAQEIAYAHREGLTQTSHYLAKEFEEIIRPLLTGVETIENKLSSLPTNELEWITVQCRMRQITPNMIREYCRKLEKINDDLCRFQKETRRYLYTLQTRTLRQATALRLQARHLTGRTTSGASALSPKEKHPIGRSKSSFNL